MELLQWGARFDRDAHGKPALAREGAHSVRRVLHARDATGREIVSVLWRRVAACPSVRVVEHARVTGLLIREGSCVGATYSTGGARPGGGHLTVGAATLLATGGAGHVFRETTNPPVATGDGVAIAFLAGARVIDLEFVQFHPTAMAVKGHPRFLLSEALRGEGATLVNRHDEAFMGRYDSAGDLAARDRVARAILREAERTEGPVYLSLRHLDPEFVHRHFPLIAEACARAGLDLATDRIPVAPAAHYIMGGVETDLDGRTSIDGLFAAGEVACTGVHGANRLASNSLLEGLVFGARAAVAMNAYRVERGEADTGGLEGLAPRPVTSPPGRDAPASLLLPAEIQDVMSRLVGVFRDGPGLAEATGILERAWRGHAAGEPADLADDPRDCTGLLTVARLIARAARRREESRGSHFRADYPAKDEINWKRRVSEERRREEPYDG
jgi:L-aspartate oxidase